MVTVQFMFNQQQIQYNGIRQPTFCIRPIEHGRKIQLTCDYGGEQYWPTYEIPRGMRFIFLSIFIGTKPVA